MTEELKKCSDAIDTNDSDAAEKTVDQAAAVLELDDAIKAAYEDMYKDTKMIRERRAMKKMKHGHK